MLGKARGMLCNSKPRAYAYARLPLSLQGGAAVLDLWLYHWPFFKRTAEGAVTSKAKTKPVNSCWQSGYFMGDFHESVASVERKNNHKHHISLKCYVRAATKKHCNDISALVLFKKKHNKYHFISRLWLTDATGVPLRRVKHETAVGLELIANVISLSWRRGENDPPAGKSVHWVDKEMEIRRNNLSFCL